MKLKEFNFNEIKNRYSIVGLCIFKDGKLIEHGFIWEVLSKIPIEFAELEIKSTRWYFNEFIIEL